MKTFSEKLMMVLILVLLSYPVQAQNDDSAADYIKQLSTDQDITLKTDEDIQQPKVSLNEIPNNFSQKNVYDPLNTMSALNSCIFSIAKIISYNDRIVLDQEYSQIINNINFGNIAADDELIELHKVMMDVITYAKLRDNEKDRFLKKYNKKTKKALFDSFSSVNLSGFNPASMITSGIVSIGSAYFSYQNAIDSYREELDDKMWGLEKESCSS